MSSRQAEIMFQTIKRKTASLRRMLLIGDLFTTVDYARPASSIFALDLLGMLEERHPTRDPKTDECLRQFIVAQSIGMSKQAWIQFYVVFGAGIAMALLVSLALNGITVVEGFDLWIGVAIAGYAILCLMSSVFRGRLDRQLRAKVQEIREDIMNLSANTQVQS